MFISGAIGDWAASINGVFEPTQEKGLDGRVLYAKRGDASMCIEHIAGLWQVKYVSNKGKNNSHAHVAGGCAPEACASRQWRVSLDGKSWSDAPGVKMVTGAEAARKVSGCCVRALDHAALPPLAAARCLL